MKNQSKIKLTIVSALLTFTTAHLAVSEEIKMPAYQFPPAEVSVTNAANWKWMRAFYDREVSQPASPNETLEEATLRAARLKPTPEKLAYMDMELITFPHFGMSTVSGVQQGTGKEDPRSFNPTAFDAREWVKFHKAIDSKMIMFVAQHHDGYALWPTKQNDYSIRSSSWRDGKGDMVKEMADACSEGGLKFGLYISLWDEHDPRSIIPRNRLAADQMTPEQRQTYQAYIEQKLHETLDGRYGEITELWFDGAGTNGAEDWNRIYEIIHHYQPKCIIAMCGFGARWCGNEAAEGLPVNWNVLPLMPHLKHLRWVPFHYDPLIARTLPAITDDLAKLQNQELVFMPEEGDTRVLEGGWHWDGVGEPRSLETFINTYYASIGSGAVLMISPSPDPSGAFNAKQLDRLVALRKWINDTFRDNLLRGAKLTATGFVGEDDPAQLLREERDRPCHGTETKGMSLIAEFPEPRTFNNLVVEEYLNSGQRISSFVLEAWQGGNWTPVVNGRTVGHKRAVPFADVTTDKIRFRILDARDVPVLKFLGIYKGARYLANKRVFADADYQPAVADPGSLQAGLRWSFYEDPNNGFLPYQEMFSNLGTTKVTATATGIDANPLAAMKSVPASRNRAEHFAMRFDGYFRAPTRAVYSFTGAANIGCRLFVNGRSVIENDASAGRAVSTDVALEAGLHRMTVLGYFGSGGSPDLNLKVEWPGKVDGPAEQSLLPLLWSAP